MARFGIMMTSVFRLYYGGDITAKTISIGALCATLLILFVLPGILASCDRLIMKKKKSRDNFS